MSKAVLVMDMPKSCYGCNLTYEDSDGMYCSFAKEDVGNYVSCRPEECPLRPIPNEREDAGSLEQIVFDKGWNACINAICEDDE